MPTIGDYSFPPELYYEPGNHVWARPDGEVVTIGLDTLGVAALGDLAYIVLKPVGAEVRHGEAAGTLEAAKMVGDLFTPVSGVITAHNEAVLRDPSLVNRNPYGAGWLAKITPADWAYDAAQLVQGVEVEYWAEGEVERYRSQGWIE